MWDNKIQEALNRNRNKIIQNMPGVFNLSAQWLSCRAKLLNISEENLSYVNIHTTENGVYDPRTSWIDTGEEYDGDVFLENFSQTIALSGGFDCAHIGHYRMFKDAAKFGKVIIFLNSDEWLTRKKGRPFMPYEERKEILEYCKYVNLVIPAIDDDNTVCESLSLIQPSYFGNGGDRKINNTPENILCRQLGISTIYSLGGEKIQSSSWLIDNAKS